MESCLSGFYSSETLFSETLMENKRNVFEMCQEDGQHETQPGF
jgi:hypothetical protein